MKNASKPSKPMRNVSFGVTFNAAFNLVLFVAVGLPLVFTREDFVEPKPRI